MSKVNYNIITSKFPNRYGYLTKLMSKIPKDTQLNENKVYHAIRAGNYDEYILNGLIEVYTDYKDTINSANKKLQAVVSQELVSQ